MSNNGHIEQRIKDLWENTDFAFTLFKGRVGYGIIAIDFDGNILAFNEGAHLMLGYEASEVVGKVPVESATNENGQDQ